MARQKPTLTVIVAPAAAAELVEIWHWNAERYGPNHADRYVDFLKRAIFGLDRSYSRGMPVTSRPDLHFIVIRRKSKGHGHLAVYRFNSTTVDVLHVLHTAQDWESRLMVEKPDE